MIFRNFPCFVAPFIVGEWMACEWICRGREDEEEYYYYYYEDIFVVLQAIL